MHINTATNCRSQYTIDHRLGVKLTCTIPLERHAAPGFKGLMHQAKYAGIAWTWNDKEADK